MLPNHLVAILWIATIKCCCNMLLPWSFFNAIQYITTKFIWCDKVNNLEIYFVATSFIAANYFWLQDCLSLRIIFGCNKVYCHELFLVATSFIATNYVWLQTSFIAMNYIWLQRPLSPRISFGCNIVYCHAKSEWQLRLLPRHWSWRLMTTSVVKKDCRQGNGRGNKWLRSWQQRQLPRFICRCT